MIKSLTFFVFFVIIYIRKIRRGEKKLLYIEEYHCYEIDDSWNENVLYKRLKEVYNTHGSIWIAYDLDDTVRPFKSESCFDTIEIIKRCKKILNAHFIVFTTNADMKANITFLEENGLPYEAINCYPNSFPIDKFKQDFEEAINRKEPPPKLYYNILLDDKSCGLEMACSILGNLCDAVEKDKKEKEKLIYQFKDF